MPHILNKYVVLIPSQVGKEFALIIQTCKDSIWIDSASVIVKLLVKWKRFHIRRTCPTFKILCVIVEE
jgi:hypothetical protein